MSYRRRRNKSERRDMISDVLNETKRYVDSRNIYMDIIDDMFHEEISNITNDNRILDLLEFQRSMHI